MSDLLTLPGEIPGLLDKGPTRIIFRNARAMLPSGREVPIRGVWVQSGPKADEGLVLWDRSFGHRFRTQDAVYTGTLLVDLHDRTSRVHAAWWACANGWDGTVALNVVVESHVLDLALRGHDMTDDEIATLRDIVLRLHEGGTNGT